MLTSRPMCIHQAHAEIALALHLIEIGLLNMCALHLALRMLLRYCRSDDASARCSSESPHCTCLAVRRVEWKSAEGGPR